MVDLSKKTLLWQDAVFKGGQMNRFPPQILPICISKHFQIFGIVNDKVSSDSFESKYMHGFFERKP